MKNFILFSLIFFSIQAFGQKKETIEQQAATIDTLTMQNLALTSQLDSLMTLSTTLSSALDSTSAGLALYYSTIKEKVLQHDFDPAALPDIIDSLRNSRDEKITGLSTESKSLADSVAALNLEITSLNATLDAIKNADADKEKLVAELKQLKELLDSGILTQSEYDEKKAKLMEKW